MCRGVNTRTPNAVSDHSASRQDDQMPPLLLIPGIGGHPKFHDALIRVLSRKYHVYTGPHIDFFSGPRATLDRHVTHWLAEFHTANKLSGRTPAVVGVSFGAQIAVSMLHLLPPSTHVVLVSYWPLTAWQRRSIACLHSFQRVGSWVIGTATFRWSERRATDLAALLHIRTTLYDDERSAKRRLFGRLLSLVDAPMGSGKIAPLKNHASISGLIYGRKERALRAILRRSQGRPTRIILIDGDHSIGFAESMQLANAVDYLVSITSSEFNGFKS